MIMKNEFGGMILAMAKVRDEIAAQIKTLEGSDEGDSTERVEALRHEITGIHKGMAIAIRTMKAGYGIEYEDWKKIQDGRNK